MVLYPSPLFGGVCFQSNAGAGGPVSCSLVSREEGAGFLQPDFHPPITGLLRRAGEYCSEADLEDIQAAYDIAATAHEGQCRDNGDPYITHPIAVASILAGFRMDKTSIMVGLLHDTIEDTNVTYESLEKRFGPDVASIVDGVTKLTRLELQSDRTKQAENFRKLVLAMSRDIRVLVVKLADRLHNMRTLHYVKSEERRRRISRETLDIYAPLPSVSVWTGSRPSCRISLSSILSLKLMQR